jgi:hypothetical protein
MFLYLSDACAGNNKPMLGSEFVTLKRETFSGMDN